MTELKAKNQKSFYGKAKIDNNCLYSYDTLVMQIVNGQPVLKIDWLSATTLKHIKAFLQENGFKAENKQQILRDYSA